MIFGYDIWTTIAVRLLSMYALIFML